MPELRRVAFLSAVAVLVAVLVGVGVRPAPSATAPSARRAASRVDDPRAPRPAPTGARTEARHFVLAFLAYEVDPGAVGAEMALRAGASRSFSRRLLSAPPAPPPGAPPPPAQLTSFQVDPIPAHPGLALASGDARRPGGPEPFGFIFARHGRRWLAVAPAE